MPDKKSILIIDDSSVNNLLLENILLDEGYEVLVTFNATEAFTEIDKKKPDLILLDIMMPGMSGYSVLKKLKTEDKTKNIPVIMVSAKSDEVDIDKSLNSGAIDYIVKPINIKTIITKINKHIN
jgi:PleD family two-component response regulator